MRSPVSALFGAGLLFAVATHASAGPIIIDGTDANDHGSVSGGVNQFGWLYMQRALENLAAQLGVGPAHAVLTLGLTNTADTEDAADAYASAFGLSSLASSGWTTSNVDGAAAIGTALASLSTTTTGILHIPTFNLLSGDLSSAEMTAINAAAVQIANFVNSGGGLFAMAEEGTGAWGWLTTLIPGLVVTSVGSGGEGNNITLTAAGVAAFPGLTNADLAGADPWHNHFSGNLGSLAVLGTSPSDGVIRNVILGGGTSGSITPTPGVVPEPGSILLIGTGVAALYGRVRRSKKASH